jgi:putative nucleotide binding protein
MTTADSDDASPRRAVLLDFFPNGRSDGGQYARTPTGFAMGTEAFGLYEIVFEEDTDVTIGDEVVIEPPAERSGIQRLREVDYESLSGGAQSELEYVVEERIEADEDRYVEFFNEAGPITLRLHQLNLLPGIGEKLRENVIDQRRRQPFADLEDLEDRVSGLHDPKGVLADRIVEEITEDDLKYYLFATEEDRER